MKDDPKDDVVVFLSVRSFVCCLCVCLLLSCVAVFVPPSVGPPKGKMPAGGVTTHHRSLVRHQSSQFTVAINCLNSCLLMYEQ